MGHLWLIGMMGSGKTTVGALVAEKLGRPLVDTDTVVMERSGRTIPELFAVSEEHFRTWEREVVAEVSSGPSSVISTGGGAILDAGNVARMAATGTRILLDAAYDELERRVGDDVGRPLLDGDADIATIARDRRDAYLAACDHVVETTGRTPELIAEEVIRCVST
jgi:shikimate kinase